MDWNRAIERNSGALKRIVAMLFAMAGISAAPTSPSRGEVAARSDAGGGDALPTTPTRPSDDGRPPLKGEVSRPTLPRRLHRAILRLLRPAESAVRRLIVIAARGLVVPPSPPPRPRKPKPRSIFTRSRTTTGIYVPPGTPLPGRPPRPAPLSIALPLFDPLKRPFRRRRPTQVCAPRISCPDPFAKLSPVKLRHPPEPDDPLDATRLTLRLNALAAALDDLPKQARRLARWRANRDAAYAQEKSRDAEAAFLAPAERGVRRTGETRGSPRHGTEPTGPAFGRPEDRLREGVRGSSATSQRPARPRFRRISPLRPGLPPGLTRRPDHEVHQLLTDLQLLAFDVLEHSDTS